MQLPNPHLEYTEAKLARLLQEWQEEASPSDWIERLATSLLESRANYRMMQQWLDLGCLAAARRLTTSVLLALRSPPAL